jgi:two-component sensor histidine kinase/putative methionine-R-sulfoxide reductase with GAF domain
MSERPTDLNADVIIKLRRHQGVLREMAHICTDKLPRDDLLADVAVQISRAVEVNHVKVMRYRAETGDLIVEAGTGWKPGVVGHATFSVDLASPGGSAFQTGQPVFIPDLRESKEFRASQVLVEHDIISVLNVPIIVDGAAWGVLEVDSVEPCDFSIDTQNFMLTAGSIVGTALRRQQVAEAHEAALAQLAAASSKLDVMLQEMHHRVKNNFQTTLSVIMFERRKGIPGTDEMLEKLGDNVIAMALAHDQLTISSSGKSVHLSNYLRTLATRIRKTIENVVVEVNAEELETPIEQAVPLGLIVNELITNSAKHAFNGAGGAVHVTLTRADAKGLLKLTVSDNGKGTDFSVAAPVSARSGGSGLKLIDALARQIRGRVERHSGKDGTRITIYFPL